VERIESDVRRELDRLGPASSIGRVLEAWPEAVGESIARNAWPSRVARDGTLHVATSSSAWTFELAQLAPTILERLRGILLDSAPKRLRFAPGPLPEPEVPEASADDRPRPSPSPAERAAAADLSAQIADHELRELVARAAAASLAKASANRPF
jgi:hypothetical protein